jgi:hypothetical protein
MTVPDFYIPPKQVKSSFKVRLDGPFIIMGCRSGAAQITKWVAPCPGECTDAIFDSVSCDRAARFRRSLHLRCSVLISRPICDFSQDVNVIGAMLHAHLTGVAWNLRHIRSALQCLNSVSACVCHSSHPWFLLCCSNGVELPMIASDPHYDFSKRRWLQTCWLAVCLGFAVRSMRLGVRTLDAVLIDLYVIRGFADYQDYDLNNPFVTLKRGDE